jgi:hypothetical protein
VRILLVLGLLLVCSASRWPRKQATHAVVRRHSGTTHAN